MKSKKFNLKKVIAEGYATLILSMLYVFQTYGASMFHTRIYKGAFKQARGWMN